MLQDEINALPGMKGVKAQVNQMVDLAMMNKLRVAAGMKPEPMTQNMLITGNPGTGKTTVTRKFGELMHELGLVKSPEVVSLTRADLEGPFSNRASANTEEVLRRNRGKVIFIDEAYTLYNGPQDAEGRKVTDELMRLAEEFRGDTMIVLAGYEDSMKHLFTANPGLKSRFPNVVNMPDYTPQEKSAVLSYMLNESNRGFDTKAAGSRAKAYAARLPSYGEHGNARAVRNFYDQMRKAQSSRIAAEIGTKTHTAADLSTFTRTDVEQAARAVGLAPIATVRSKPKATASRDRAGYRARKVSPPEKIGA